MKKLYPIAIAVLSFTAVACNEEPTDAEIQQHVTQQLQDNNYPSVNATVTDGVVTLSGMCEGADCVTQIADSVQHIDGVDRVENNIAMDNSTDMTMRTSVQTIITKYPGVQADVASGVIVLRGNISRDNLNALMSDLSNLHPEKIDNQLVID